MLMPAVNGIAIRQARLDCDGMKRSKLAELCGTRTETIGNLEYERRPASVELIYRMAKHLNRAPEDLVADPKSLEFKPAERNSEAVA